MRHIVFSLTVMCMAWMCAGERPHYIGCETSEECGKGSCCVIGMGRYTIPRCETYRDLAESCRPNGSPVNVSLEYPDRKKVDLSGVYFLMCPCQRGLSCETDETGSESPRCMDSFLDNQLDYDYEDSRK